MTWQQAQGKERSLCQHSVAAVATDSTPAVFTDMDAVSATGRFRLVSWFVMQVMDDTPEFGPKSPTLDMLVYRQANGHFNRPVRFAEGFFLGLSQRRFIPRRQRGRRAVLPDQSVSGRVAFRVSLCGRGS